MDVDDMRVEIVATWPDLPHLREITDEVLLAEIADSLAEATGVAPSESVDGYPTGPEEVRISLDPRRAVRQALHALDRMTGAVIGAAGGGINSYVREATAPGISAFLGDVLVYQRHRERIHDRVWSAIRAAGAALGSAHEPVAVLAHSLGGVISFDMATMADGPLHVSKLLTFGSQSPLFHLMDPRAGVLASYAGAPVVLPATIGRWLNLWEPLDPLAFIAARVFVLASGQAPEDRATAHLASYGLWTHSSYWQADDVARAARDLLA